MNRTTSRPRPRRLAPRGGFVAAWAVIALACGAITGVPAYANPEDAQVERWQRFRQSFGLRDDAGFAEWVGRRASLGAPEVSVAYGTPLTVEEAALIDARTVQSDAQSRAIRGYLRDKPEQNGGMFFDHRRGGRMVVLVTGNAATAQRDLHAVVPHADKLDVRLARHSVASLRRIQDRIARDGYRERGIEVVSTTLRVAENAVEVRVRSDVSAAEAAFARDFPAGAFRVVRGDYLEEHGTREKNSPPFRGGQAIGRGSEYECSIGFVAHDGASQYFAITAGHCGSTGSAWYQPCCAGVGAGVGVMDYNPFLAGTSITDSARIPILSERKSNHVTRTMPGGGIYYYAITSWEGQGADDVGDAVCHAGARTNWDCGQITATSHDYYSSTAGHWFYYARKTDMKSDKGDSGGPYFYVPVAKGIHQGKDRNYIEDPTDDETVYSHIYDVLDDLYLLGVYTG